MNAVIVLSGATVAKWITPDIVWAGVATIVLLIGVIIGLVIYYHREIDEICDSYESEIKKIKEKQQRPRYSQGTAPLKAEPRGTSSPVSAVKSQSDHPSSEEVCAKQTPEVAEEAKPEVQPTKEHYTYLNLPNGERFSVNRNPDKCYFRMWNDGNVLRYEFSGNVAKALANLNAVFDNTCYLQGSQINAKGIETVASGELDEQLKIKKKAVIKLVE